MSEASMDEEEHSDQADAGCSFRSGGKCSKDWQGYQGTSSPEYQPRPAAPRSTGKPELMKRTEGGSALATSHEVEYIRSLVRPNHWPGTASRKLAQPRLKRTSHLICS
ncbi:hypothetical protein HPP92_022618 [Vanilla planifolia]|uniref:Uncharacterized protein n=1 Tax=Vanilla planifolia TaxID=51239 RepID=A0A835PNV6_VANPL|nr:hypothetical protein HPP92_022618 [Vanilla planifolia]